MLLFLSLQTLARFPPRLLSESSRFLPREAWNGPSSLCGRLGERERIVVGFRIETGERVVYESAKREKREVVEKKMGKKKRESEPMGSLVSSNGSDGVQESSIGCEPPIGDGDLCRAGIEEYKFSERARRVEKREKKGTNQELSDSPTQEDDLAQSPRYIVCCNVRKKGQVSSVGVESK